MKLKFWIPLLGALAAHSVLAEDAGLYADAAPDDAAFVRFFGFPADSTAQFGGRVFETGESNAYVAISASQLNGVAPGSYTSVVFDEEGPMATISEPLRTDRSKVHLFVVNASAHVMSLKTSDGGIPVVKNVAPGMSVSRAVNPVKAALALFVQDEDTPIAAFDLVLRRGQNVSFVVTGSDVQLVEHQFEQVNK